MSNLLINENPMMVIPSLAKKIGLNEALFLQQVHYWLVRSSHEIEGEKWIYNTYKDWQDQLSFWSESTIKRTIKSLEDKGYLISGNWNRLKLDKTKWYSIDYKKVEALDMAASSQFGQSCRQADPSGISNSPMEEAGLARAIPEITTENTTEKDIPYKEIIDYLNRKTNSTYKAFTRKTRELIRARWNEGFRLEDFIKVIDLKAAEWLNDPQWSKYLRPETLFGVKFESYLNQKSNKKLWREEDFDLND
ncbi:conserved phage C-terminal domain-containing protein [Bacillus sp. T33-2]|uniref:conserved phage C-terminal domain-containing protein n=1 Tax=Bacillus sp. T33-2 TaxID=2054168 RepID=UPI000C792BF1|nr:conserved phage C-terminal domain-containing protein [Bacillus sp. T33-2]PLR95737.1 replication protein [Bacillus sp. T33-2]